MAIVQRVNWVTQRRVDLPDMRDDMGSLFSASRGPCKIEITTESGEKFSYNAMITQHDIQMGPSHRPIHMMANGMVEEVLVSQSKEITLKFVELNKVSKSKPKPKPVDLRLKAIEEEEML